jgi:hypothetical protein
MYKIRIKNEESCMSACTRHENEESVLAKVQLHAIRARKLIKAVK